MNNSDLSKLRFRPGLSSGFTPAGISGFSDLRPAAIIRELVQNSLDAAIEADVKSAKIRFRLTRCGKEEIPGIQEYEEAFNLAVTTHREKGELRSQARRVVRSIQRALDQTKPYVLSVLDNGIGLNESRMNALLSDGISVKGRSAMGTYGNGHSTVIPASDLRYVLYGGIDDKRNRIGAGHAVLASSNSDDKEQPTSGDGFFDKGMKGGRHICAMNHELPDLIAKEIDWIEQNMEHGTAVIIPAFNHFRENKESLCDRIFESAARSFFLAIQENRLIVEMEDLCAESESDDLQILNSTNLKRILKKDEDNRRKSKGAFISGARAYSAYVASQNDKWNIIKTEIGDVEIRYESINSGRTWIDLCRNGMWITGENSLPKLKSSAFADRQPFHAVLILDSKSGKKLHELVRNAEGPLHNELSLNRLEERERQELRNAFGEIKKRLKEIIPAINSASYSPDDFLVLVDFRQEGETGQKSPSFWGTPVAVTKRVPPSSTYKEADTGDGHSRRRGSKRVQKNTNPRPQPLLGSAFNILSVPVESNHKKIIVGCHNSVKNAQLRLCIDENIDATCDLRSIKDTETLGLKNIQIDGEFVDEEKFIRKNGNITGVHLGDIESGKSLEIVLEYSLPSNLILPPDYEPTPRVDILRGVTSSESDD